MFTEQRRHEWGRRPIPEYGDGRGLPTALAADRFITIQSIGFNGWPDAHNPYFIPRLRSALVRRGAWTCEGNRPAVDVVAPPSVARLDRNIDRVVPALDP